jgi:small-conductance mechanosensitive channel
VAAEGLATSRFWSLYTDDLIFATIVIVVAIVITRVGTISVHRLQRRMETARSARQELSRQRAATVAHTLNYAVRVTVWTIAILTLLGRANIELGPLIAGAGVAGVALGFGAQSIVRDYLAGFYLLIEDQFDVGDVVDIFVAGVKLTGSVLELTLRTTSLRAPDGQMHVVPNGGFAFVTNHSRGEGEVRLTVRVEPWQDPAEIRRLVDELEDDVQADPTLRLAVFDGPIVQRLDPVGDALEVDVVASARPERRDEVALALRERLERRLRALPSDVDVREIPPDGSSPAGDA